MMTAVKAPSASGAKIISSFRYHEASRLAPAVARNPAPRIQNDRPAPSRITTKPALVLTVTISISPSHVCGFCRGTSPPVGVTTNAAWTESMTPARQTAHVARPAAKANINETIRDFQEKVFKTRFGGGL